MVEKRLRRKDLPSRLALLAPGSGFSQSLFVRHPTSLMMRRPFSAHSCLIPPSSWPTNSSFRRTYNCIYIIQALRYVHKSYPCHNRFLLYIKIPRSTTLFAKPIAAGLNFRQKGVMERNVVGQRIDWIKFRWTKCPLHEMSMDERSCPRPLAVLKYCVVM